MKAIFIAYNQAYNEEVVELLSSLRQRGFTRWQNVEGKGGFNGEPHLGNHAWPVLNQAVLTMVPDEKVDTVMEQLKSLDEGSKDLGLRAFVWNIENYI